MRPVDGDELFGIIKLHDIDIIRNSKEASFLLDQILFDVKNVPTLEGLHVVQSHWEPGGKNLKDLYCINCVYILPRKCNELAESGDFEYCPKCGAKMRRET